MSKGEETRDRIVNRAFRLATRDGLSGLSLGKLAGELGLSKSGLFAHFGSKEGLELDILKLGAERFVEEVIRPALTAPRGLPRVRKLFRNWLAWMTDPGRPGGCVFWAASVELDDADGAPRDFLVGTQTAMLQIWAKAARISIEAGHFRPDLDCEQFAFEALGVAAAFHHSHRLLRDPKAESRAHKAFERLVASAAAS